MRARRQKIRHAARAPDGSAQRSCHVPAEGGLPIITAVHRLAAIERLLHQQPVRRHGGDQHADDEKQRHSIRPRRSLPWLTVQRPRYKGIKAAHQHAARQAYDNAAHCRRLGCGFALAVGRRVQHNRHYHQRHAAKQQHGIAHRLDYVIRNCADDQREADPHREGHRHAGDINRGHQQQVRHVEDRAARHRIKHGRDWRLRHVVQKRRSHVSQAPRRQSPEDRAHCHADRVIPVEKLEAITGAQLQRVRPRSPAQHSQDRQAQRGQIRFGSEHRKFLPFNRRLAANREP